jgi:hypothetical protein
MEKNQTLDVGYCLIFYGSILKTKKKKPNRAYLNE